MKQYRLLVINPGSTSTKIGYFAEGAYKDLSNIPYTYSIDKDKTIFDQIDPLVERVFNYMQEHSLDSRNIDAVVARGPAGGKFKSGCYLIEQSLIDHCYDYAGPHVATISPIIGKKVAETIGVEAYIYDADGVNEFNEFATLSGSKLFPITPACHTLAHKSAARKYCEDHNLPYEEVNLVVCHVGGGSSTAAHMKGKIVDATLDGYAPERMGSMPMLGMIDFTRACYSGKYTVDEMIGFQMGKGGLVSYLGTRDILEIEKRIENGDKEAEYYFDGMVYQQSKDIATMSMVLEGKVDQIILTGGVANSKQFTEKMIQKVEWIAPVSIYPGSYEMESLAKGVTRALNKQEEIHLFNKKPVLV